LNFEGQNKKKDIKKYFSKNLGHPDKTSHLDYEIGIT
jgi:hypothetical protein